MKTLNWRDVIQFANHGNPNSGYCRVVIDPKIQKLRARYADKLIKESA